MASRGQKRFRRSDTGKPLSDEDIYAIVMAYQYRTMDLRKIAQRYGLSTSQVRDVVGRRLHSSCCG